MKIGRTCRLVLGLLVPAGAALAQTSTADVPPTAAGKSQDNAQDTISDITVTATRTERSLQQVPISVSAISGADIEQKSIPNVVDVARTLPNVTATNGPQGSTDANFFIRGVGQYDFIITNDPGVGVYLDGVYLGRTEGAQLDSLDIARIEVLRGPQGSLFGRNTIGGAVNIVTEKPKLTGTVYGTAQVNVGDYDLHSEQVAVNVPVTPDFAFRVTAIDRQEDGYAHRTSDGAEFGAVNTKGVRTNLLWDVAESLTAEMEADYTYNGGTQFPTELIGAAPGKSVGVGPSQLNIIPLNYLQYQYNPRHSDVTQTPINPDERAETYGVSLTLTEDAGFATFKSISALRGLTNFNEFQAGFTPYELFTQPTRADQRQFTQELQMYGKALDDRVDYLFGLYYFHENAHQEQALCLAQGPVNPFGTCAYWNQDNYQTTDSYAAFGQATVQIIDGVAAVLGVRGTYDQKHIDSTQFYGLQAYVPGFEIPIVTGATNNHDWRDVSPHLGLNWQIDEDALLYASYSKGYRSGGFNGRIAVPGSPLLPYKPDINSQWEVGTKLDLLDRRLRFDLAGYYSTYRDIQLTVVDPILGFKVANAGQAEVYGFESEITAVPLPKWNIHLGVGYTYSDITSAEAALAPNRVFVGNTLPFAPRWNGALGTDYTIDLPGDHGALNLRADATAQSSEYFSPSNQPLEHQQGYALLNLRATYIFPGGLYRIGMWGRNVTDRRYFTFGEDAVFNQGVAYGQLARGADFGATLQADF